MHFAALFVMAAGLVLLIVLGFLWPRPEYGLLAWGIALGFPDAVIPMGAVNLRIDDVLLLLLLPRTFIWSIGDTRSQKSTRAVQFAFLGLCCFSIVIEFLNGNPPPGYEVAKMLGCGLILFSLPRLVEGQRTLRFLLVGLMIGGVALTCQIAYRLLHSSGNVLANFQELKSAATFATWNPNTIGQAGILLAFSAGAGAIFFGKTRLFGVIWFSFAVIFALTPAILFARGSTLAIATGFVLFLALTRRWLLVSTIVLIGITVFVAADRVIGDVVHRATDVNVETGQGFSGRYSRWDKAIEAIRSQPITGYGFGQEWPVLSSIGSEGRAHNAYLSVWLEMGLGGLTLLCAVVAAYLRTAYLLIRRPETRDLGALMLALVVAICMDSFGLPTLYWEKLPTIGLALSLALTGIGERLQWRPVVRRDSNLTAQVGHASYGAA